MYIQKLSDYFVNIWYSMKRTKITVHNKGRQLNSALKLIEIFKSKNNVNLKVEIKLDFEEKDLGYYLYEEKDQALYINPIRCTQEEHGELRGSPFDNSIYGTVIHEFSHYLDQKYEIINEYLGKKFFVEFLILNKNCIRNRVEELAEIISIYLVNPYYLKLVDEERFKWIKTKFKSPSRCGKKTFMRYYEKWPEKYQIRLKEYFKITINEGEIIRC